MAAAVRCASRRAPWARRPGDCSGTGEPTSTAPHGFCCNDRSLVANNLQLHRGRNQLAIARLLVALGFHAPPPVRDFALMLPMSSIPRWIVLPGALLLAGAAAAMAADQ